MGTMTTDEQRRYLEGNIEAHELQIRLVEAQLARLRRMHPRARGVASGIAQDERTLASHRASLAARRAELAAPPPAPGSAEYAAADARWGAHLAAVSAGAGADAADLIDRD